MLSLTSTATARGSMHSCLCCPHHICTAVGQRTAQRVYSRGGKPLGKNELHPHNIEAEMMIPECFAEQEGARQAFRNFSDLAGQLSTLAGAMAIAGRTAFIQPQGRADISSYNILPDHGPARGGQTTTVFSSKTPDGSTNDAVAWADFWERLEKAASGSKLDYTAFVYKAHELHLPAQRRKFQQAVASGSSTSSSTVLSREDFDNLLSQTGSRHLAEAVDLAMNMAWTEWYGGDGNGCTVSPQVQAPAGSWITAWSAGTHEAGATGSNIMMLQGKWGKGKWLDAVYAYPDEQKRGTVSNTPYSADGFTQVYGTFAEGQRLVSFMGLPTSGAGVCTGTPWTSVEPERLPLDCPARIVGYQARIKAASGQQVIDSVRFLVRSFVTTDTLYPAAFISYTGWDSEANLFATQLATALEAKGVPCFFAEAELTAGVKWAAAIRDLSSHCKVFVPVVSPHYLDRPWCLAELHLAVNKRAAGAASVPVLVSGLGLAKDDIVQLTKEPLGAKQQGWYEKWAGLVYEIAKDAGVETLAPSDIRADFIQLLEEGMDEKLRSRKDVEDVAEKVACRV